MNDSALNQPNLIYLGLIAIFLIINFISSSKDGIFTIIKYLSIWIIIILIIIIAYGYRYELRDVKERVKREFISGSSTHQTKNRSIILNQSQDGHFYLNAIINGQPIRFLVDTGASDVALSSYDAKKIGVNLDQIKFDKIYQTANGKTYGAKIMLDHLMITDVKFKKIPASVMSSNIKISLLGMSFLNKLKKYEFKNNNLILYY